MFAWYENLYAQAEISEVEHLVDAKFEDFTFAGLSSNGARLTFIKKAFEKANPPNPDFPTTKDAYGGAPNEDALLQAQFLRLLGPQKKKVEEVDIPSALAEARLAEHFEVNQWPPHGALRELATQFKSKPFVCCDLHKYVIP